MHVLENLDREVSSVVSVGKLAGVKMRSWVSVKLPDIHKPEPEDLPSSLEGIHALQLSMPLWEGCTWSLPSHIQPSNQGGTCNTVISPLQIWALWTPLVKGKELSSGGQAAPMLWA